MCMNDMTFVIVRLVDRLRICTLPLPDEVLGPLYSLEEDAIERLWRWVENQGPVLWIDARGWESKLTVFYSISGRVDVGNGQESYTVLKSAPRKSLEEPAPSAAGLIAMIIARQVFQAWKDDPSMEFLEGHQPQMMEWTGEEA